MSEGQWSQAARTAVLVVVIAFVAIIAVTLIVQALLH
jgi:hypothetical protein